MTFSNELRKKSNTKMIHGPNKIIQARPGPGPTKKKCRAGPAQVNRKILSLCPARHVPMGIKEKYDAGQGSSPGPAPSSLMLEGLRFLRN